MTIPSNDTDSPIDPGTSPTDARSEEQLALDKIRLEISKLQAESLDRDLQREKLRLEIVELGRTAWLKPSVMVPIAATIATLAFSQWLGVFDVERKRVELSNRELVLQQDQLKEQIKKLAAERTGLEELKTGLGAEVASLRSEVAHQKALLGESTDQARKSQAAAESAGKQLADTRGVLDSARLNFDYLHYTVANAGSDLQIVNKGKAPATVMSTRAFVDGRQVASGPVGRRFDPIMAAVGITEPWVRYYWLDEGSQVQPGEHLSVLMIEPSRYSTDRADRFDIAMRRLGLEVCYCTLLNQCRLAVFNEKALAGQDGRAACEARAPAKR